MFLLHGNETPSTSSSIAVREAWQHGQRMRTAAAPLQRFLAKTRIIEELRQTQALRFCRWSLVPQRIRWTGGDIQGNSVSRALLRHPKGGILVVARTKKALTEGLGGKIAVHPSTIFFIATAGRNSFLIKGSRIPMWHRRPGGKKFRTNSLP